ncbi:hypothetical protein ACP4OV_000349 [Aristida adscensionis]
MQQRKPKVVCAAEGAAQGATEQEIPPAAQAAMTRHGGGWPPEPEGGGPPEHQPVLPRKAKKLQEEKRWSTLVNVVLVAFLMAVPPAVVLFAGGGAGTPAVWIAAAKAQLRRGSDAGSFPNARSPPDKFLGGLLPQVFDERSCRSRYESATYRRNPGRQPSPHLVAKLRRHEELQRRCGPNTDAYSRAIQQLRSGKAAAAGSPECKYLVSISYRGLGNRILAAASAFLYALLTDRVLLVDPSNDMAELFCEPFPGTTWLLPPGFPLPSYTNFSADTAESYGNMLKNKALRAGDEAPAFAYLHLDHDYGDEDKMFFCDDDQRLLSRVPWLVMRTDLYIAPGLFLQLAAFREELGALFPERDAVFHHLGRYLFHPTNRVWGLVTRYHRAYLARAELLLGVQVRAFDQWQAESPHVLRQITSCVWRERLLPELLAGGEEEHAAPPPPPPPPPAAHGAGKSKTVLITSLRSWYYERIKAMYWEQPAAGGEEVSVHQPSHDEHQKYGEKSHEAKAWAEMYLLSLCDALVTSGWSTFGYVAQGLAGVTPWVMYRPINTTEVPEPPCGRDVSMEPCFHAPPVYDCKLRQGADTGKMVPHVRYCKDVGWGLKLVDPNTYQA